VGTGRRAEGAEAVRSERNPLARAGALLFGLVLIVVKLLAVRSLLHDGRVALIVLFGIGALIALRRGRPLGLAFSLGLVVGAAVSGPIGVRIAIGAGGVVAFTLLAYLIGVVWMRLDNARV
jgi:hypothetical protein